MVRRLLLYAAVLTLLSISSLSEFESTSFRIVNNCRHTIWPGLRDLYGTAQLPTTGFTLKSGESEDITVSNPWQGWIWARTHCGRNSSGKFKCLTGDCGSGELECTGGAPQVPTTLFEFSVNRRGFDGLDYYDVTLVDGFNLPMLITAKGTTGACATTGCLVDLNSACPKVLSVAHGDGRDGRVVACRNACEGKDFTEPIATVKTNCGRSLYAQFFKSACPRAYVQPFNDPTGTLSCRSGNYTITFCPFNNTGKTTD